MSCNNDLDTYEVCFVENAIVQGGANYLNFAFEAMVNHDLEPKWVTEESCMTLKKKEAKLFVLDPFSGKVYDHLRGLECRIIGPLCILSCLQRGETLPKKPHPVYSVSMRNITVTCSNLDKTVREEIWEKVHLMGGNCSKDLTKSVTHLVVGEVGSKKYHVAANFGLPIMLPTWVREIWDHGQYDQVHASDVLHKEFRCPVFQGLSITVSQLSSKERNKYKALIESNGGRYSGAMKSKDTTHLVLLEPKGDKYNFAMSWKLHCVKTDWIDDSLNAGHCMDENLYKLGVPEIFPPEKKSTPISGKADANLEIDCSSINVTLLSNVDESTRTDASIIFKGRFQHSICLLDEFDVSTLPKCGQFLDGCKIYLTGFKGAHLEKLRKIVNAGGGMRFSSFSESISHVICGEKNSDLVEQIKSSTVKPSVVTSDWLLECSKHQKLVDEGPFRCIDFLSLTPTKDPVAEADLSNKQNSSLFSKDITLADDFSDILKQYCTESSQANVNISNVEKNSSFHMKEADNKPISGEPSSKIDHHSLQKDVNLTPVPAKDLTSREIEKQQIESDANEINDSVFHVAEDNLFDGKVFKVVGFAPKETDIISNMVLFHAGVLLDSVDNAKKKCDIAIVPLIWNDFSVNANVIVTNCWLQKCIEEKTVFDFDENELFSPFDIDLNIQPLKGLVISVSQYAGTERDCLMHLAEMLGAQCQEYFVRKANSSRGLLPNTHLIVATPEGSKYEASKKWNIPAVTKHWLLTAATSKSAPPIERYLVGTPKESTFFSDIVCLSKNNVSDNKAANTVDDTLTAVKVTDPVSNQKRDSSFGNKKSASNTFALPNQRVRELIECSRSYSPVSGTKNVSPERFNESSYKPNFDTSGILRALVSTPSSSDSDHENKRKKVSMTMEDVLDHNLAAALNFVESKSEKGLSEQTNVNATKSTPKAVDSNQGILNGVVLCVSKKLGSIQLEVNRIVHSLGGEYRWTFDSSCTHYIFQGKANDLSKEFREARRLGKHIVSPEWIFACKDAGVRVIESQYPHTFKSRLSLTEISTSKGCTTSSVAENIIKGETCSPKNVGENIETVLDNRECLEDVSKQLDEIIVAAKTAKAGKRRIQRNNSNCDSPLNRSCRNGTGTLSPAYTNTHLHVIENEDAVGTEPSQSLPITWDDPTGRMEREKIAANDARKSKKSSNENCNQNVCEENLNSEPKCDVFSPISVNQNTTSSPSHLRQTLSIKKFMFTSLAESEKQQYSSLIISLGGQVSDSKFFDETATHLILGQPIKNEKFLASVASGKWVLHKSYLDDSVVKNTFLSEELYEWGSDSTSSFWLNQSRNSLKLSICPRRWRLKKQCNNCSAFHGWKVAIVADKQKVNSYERILRAGGAEVFSVLFLQSNEEKLTHAFVEVGKNSHHAKELEFLAACGVKFVKPEYLAFYLIEDPPPSEDDYLVPEFIPSDKTTSKRRMLANPVRDKKKTKLTEY